MSISAALILGIITPTTPPDSFKENWVMYVYENKADEFLQKYEYKQFSDAVSVYKSDTQGYLVVLQDNAAMPNEFFAPNNNHFMSSAVILFLVALVYLTNRTLTRLISKSIMSPINTLVNGVHEIRDGNLTYRIEYKNNDEFAAVCSDFNEMAARLLDMVNQRQKDEQNRRELIAGISHDLRTPLTSIKSYVKGLQDGVATNPEKVKGYLDVTYRKTCELEKLIDHLFLFSKLETDSFPFHLKPQSIHNYFVTLLDSLEYDLQGTNAAITLNSSCETQKVLLDGEQMQRAISNIIDNSIKYNKGRVIHIDTTLQQVGGNIIIRLQDDGAGVSEAQLSRLFDIFYRGDESRTTPSKGNGLGLSIAKKIVTAHGGKIKAENSNGLAIIIELPIETIETEEKA